MVKAPVPGDEKYDRVVDLKKRVIDPAVEEINQHSNMGEVRPAQIRKNNNAFPISVWLKR
ncbi:RepB family plasmid replication initiator protein [Methylomonas albis]|uniref:Replication initiation protein n=1 Tax=Methylomonas albis TaxID=1854563 RepID=A0ABR9D720_9GAMM|nr:RepB family plasmid replication initiator protein [Methylomonas albis]MBD9358922.1 replication initiation protein [Methylomonas albis]